MASRLQVQRSPINIRRTGIYTAIVTASNPLYSLSSTVTVTITDVPLAGLIVTNTSPVRPGKPVTLSATVLTGTATSYAWAFGDDTLGAGRMVTQTYAVSGLYTATVTATNAADVLVARTVITVYRQFYLPVALDRWPYMPGTPVLGAIDNAIGATQYAITWTSVSDASSYLLQESTNAAFTSPVTAYTGTGNLVLCHREDGWFHLLLSRCSDHRHLSKCLEQYCLDQGHDGAQHLAEWRV